MVIYRTLQDKELYKMANRLPHNRGKIQKGSKSRFANDLILNRMKEKNISVTEMHKYLGISRPSFYFFMANPQRHLTIEDMKSIAIRLDLELRVVIAYVLGCEGREDKEGKFWFE